MNIKTRNATLIAVLAAVGATAWAANELADPNYDPIMAQVQASQQPPVTPAPEPTDPAPPPAEPGLAPQSNEPAPAAAASPAPEAVAQPPVIVEDRRMSLDQRIQAQVIDRLASAPDLTGQIGVESNDAVVTLTGTVFSGAHAARAGRYARDVQDVKYVQNELRSQLSRW